MKRKHMLLIAILGALGVVIDSLHYEIVRTPNTVFDFFDLLKYFTIQSNLIVVVYFTINYFKPMKSNHMRNLIGCVVLCITLTFVMFVIFLEPIWNPTGFGLVSNILLHYLCPISAIIYLIIYRNDYEFVYKDILYWIVYPICYMVFVTIFGLITGDFLYPFIDLNSLGLGGFALNIFGMFSGNLLLSFLIVKIVSQKNTVKN